MKSAIFQKFPKSVRLGLFLLAVLTTAFVVVESLLPNGTATPVGNTDKIVHFSAYFILGVLWIPALGTKKPWIVVLALAVLGLVIEGLQGMLDMGRSADIFDALANICGAICALLFWSGIFLALRRFRK